MNIGAANIKEINMQNFKSIWKTLVDEKRIAVQDMLAYSILRAMIAKSESKKEIAKYFVAKSFPKKKNDIQYHAALKAHRLVKTNLRWKKTVLGVPIEEIFSSEEEFYLFKDILDTLTFDFDRVYTYVFVRQDLSPEYQLVQAAHATMVLGQMMPSHYNSKETYFTVIGVPNEWELKQVKEILNKNEFPFEEFIEPDIGNEITAVATHPIHWMKRRPLKDYQLLTFNQEYLK